MSTAFYDELMDETGSDPKGSKGRPLKFEDREISAKGKGTMQTYVAHLGIIPWLT